ncbi:hypothetical protein ACS0TY_008205 [Phlomoides rotata]
MIPVAGIESLLDNKTCLKSLHNLHWSISHLILDKYFLTLDTKKRLINPSIPHFYISKNTLFPLHEESFPSLCYYYLLGSHGDLKLSINRWHRSSNSVVFFKSPKGEHYVNYSITYMVTDDLTVTPFCMTSGFSFLNRLNIPVSDVDELEVPIGSQEGLSILKASISSNSALTNGLMNRIVKKNNLSLNIEAYIS